MLDRTMLTMSVCINQTKKNKGRCKFSKQCKKIEDRSGSIDAAFLFKQNKYCFC